MFSLTPHLVTNNDPYFYTPLTFIAAQANSSVKLTANGSPVAASSLFYGVDVADEINWTKYTPNTVITLEKYW